jgi:sirohydrochlorin ferrochelatase
MRKFGVQVISHGSRDVGWVEMVDQAVSQLQIPPQIEAVESSFLEIVEGRLIQDGTNNLLKQGITDIIVIPLFVSSASTHIDEIAWAIGAKETPILETDLEKVNTGNAIIHWCEPMDDDPEVIAMLLHNIQALTESPQNEVLFIMGHGSIEKHFHQRWKQGLERIGSKLVEQGNYAGFEICMLLPDQVNWRMKQVQKKWGNRKRIIVPVFLSEGYFTRTVVPKRLEGYAYAYNGKTLLPNPNVTAWMERRILQKWQTIV